MNVISEIQSGGGGRRTSASLRPIARVAGGMGQSNFAGMEGEEGNLISAWQGAQSSIMAANYGTYAAKYPTTNTADFSFEPMNPGVNAWSLWGNTPVGPEQSYLHAIQERFGETIYSFKLAFGGKAISSWLAAGDLYNAMHTGILDVERYLHYHGYRVVYQPMIWQQGEANVDDSVAARTANMLQLIDDYRSISAATAIQPWILVNISTYQTTFNSTQRGHINNANASVKLARPYIDVIDPSDIAGIDAQDPSAPGLHYSLVPAMVAIGQACFDLADSNGWIV